VWMAAGRLLPLCVLLPRSHAPCPPCPRGCSPLPCACAASSLLLRRYASLYFIASIDADDNELITLEMIHLFVEVLDRYFGNVCELDIIFNFHKAYYILDELFIGGNLQETSKKEVLKVCAQQDDMMEETEPGKKKKIST